MDNGRNGWKMVDYVTMLFEKMEKGTAYGNTFTTMAY